MDRRGFLAAGAAMAAVPAWARTPALRLSLLGQALIEHAPAAHEWPGRADIAAHLARNHVVFTNLETVVQGPNAGAPTRELLMTCP